MAGDDRTKRDSLKRLPVAKKLAKKSASMRKFLSTHSETEAGSISKGSPAERGTKAKKAAKASEKKTSKKKG